MEEVQVYAIENIFENEENGFDETHTYVYYGNRRDIFYFSKYRMTLQGFHAAIQFAGMSFVTTLHAQIIVLSPMVTPQRIMHPEVTQQFFPMFISLRIAFSKL